jgi:hypothetical protein
MGDLIFVALVVAFFALTVAYVRGCERIVGADTGAGLEGDAVAGSPGADERASTVSS